MGFLSFSRGMEREADYLGLQYMYKAGYDPTSFVDFFEKIQTMEKRKPGTVAKVFSTHPMTDDRIKASQKEIQTDPEGQAGVRGEYFGVQRREGAPVFAAQPQEDRTARTIRTVRRCGAARAAAPVRWTTTTTAAKPDQDERPTLKRRDNS